MKKHYRDLVCAIQDPAGLAGSLYSRGIISQSVRDEVQQRGDLITKRKNEVLINAVEAQVTTDPSMFQVFMEVLKEEPSLSTIVERMSGLGERAHWRIVMLIGYIQCVLPLWYCINVCDLSPSVCGAHGRYTLYGPLHC